MKIKNYTENQIEYIKNNYLTMTAKEIGDVIGKSSTSVSYVGNKLGLTKQVHAKWTDKEIQFLKDNYIEMTSESISKYINHSIAAINTMRDRLGLVRNANWSDEECDFLKQNYNTMTYEEIAKILGKTSGAIRAKSFDLGLYKNLQWSKEEETYILNNYREMSYLEMASSLNRSHDAIQLKARKLGLRKSPYFCDYHYFDSIDTEEKAYWLGFLTADGWISHNEENNAGVTGVELQYEDIDHLKKFNKSISGNYKITDRWRDTFKTGKLTHMCVIRIYSMIMYQSLTKLGFTKEKSFDGKMPHLRDDLIRHFLRGYFDGNGCFSYNKKTLSVSFLTASKQLNNDLLETINGIGLTISGYEYISNHGTHMYRPAIYRYSDKIKFLQYIYNDCNIYLDRKYNKYLKVINNFQHDGLAC